MDVVQIDLDDEYMDEDTRKLRLAKRNALKRFPSKVTRAVDLFFEELICEAIFQFHMELNVNTYDPKDVAVCSSLFNKTSGYNIGGGGKHARDETLTRMADELNINKINQDIECPKCSAVVKCPWLSKHLAQCMNPHKNNYSLSARNSSRIARQRIQDGFKTGVDETKNDQESEEERTPTKKRNNKTKKAKFKGLKTGNLS
ncbi:SAGA-associated factor 11 homolog [Daktulosphaira vitifoliae]|uniref:SAGA-associated factor 11 homolog n=1 Tax=Daktulosphaira vitifoliae TaxID=58002 RepID=UPI0021A9BE00|nr:SAGA-associated factor 11 homolog [Daktulosphaira vitifoliae]